MSENKTTRQQAYKSNAKTTTEMRVRRHEVTVELRKSKKDDQMLKRRNIDVDNPDPTSPLKEQNAQSPPVHMTLEEIFEGMLSGIPSEVFIGTQAARKMLSRERNPPIDIMVKLGIVPICTSFLDASESPDLQFEAAWALTNVASGTTEDTQAVVKAGAIPLFVKLLGSPVANVAEQSVWALGNIAGDGPTTRDIVLNHNAVEELIKLITPTTQLSFLRNIVWLMSNLCRNKNPPPPFEKIRPMLPVLSMLLQHADVQVLTDASWAISYLTDDDNLKIQAVVDAGCIPHLVRLLDQNEAQVIVPSLRSVGNIVTGTDSQTDAVLEANVLPNLSKLLRHPKSSIVKEAAWTVSNITAGNPAQVQIAMDSNIFVDITNVLTTGDFRAQKEAAWVVTNATTSGTPEQIVQLIDKYGILKPFCDLLATNEPRTIKVVLTGLTNLFQLAQKMGGTESLCVLFEQIGALDKLEPLQNHENEDIYKMAYEIIDSYFSDEAADQPELAPAEANGELAFDGEVPSDRNGFSF